MRSQLIQSALRQAAKIAGPPRAAGVPRETIEAQPKESSNPRPSRLKKTIKPPRSGGIRILGGA